MDSIGTRQFTIYFSGDSKEVAQQILEVTQRSYPIFIELFDAKQDLRLDIFWVDRRDWSQIPQCRNKDYGMPHMTKGENHKHYIILPAANIDEPVQLIRIIKPLLDIKKLSKDETCQLTNLLSTVEGTSISNLDQYLSSKEFYIHFLIEIVLLHEIMHDFCFEFGIPENYGKNGQKAWWLFEGLAQWSVLWVHRRLGNDHWVGLHELLYRWMYRTGQTYRGNISPINYSNYAWFHGILIEMFCQLENEFGNDYGPAILKILLKKMNSNDFLSNQEIIATFSCVANQDLSTWFKSNWKINKN